MERKWSLELGGGAHVMPVAQSELDVIRMLTCSIKRY